MGHPQRQDLGTRNWNFFKICRSGGEKIRESNSSQQVPESYWTINFILTRKGFLQWLEYELGWILRRRKANLNRSAIILFVHLDPELKLVGLNQIGTHGTSAIGKTISELIIGKSVTKLKCAIECLSTRQLGAVASSRTASNSSKTTSSDNHPESFFFFWWKFLYRSCWD